MPEQLVLAIDQGSSSTKALLVDPDGAVVAVGTSPVASSYPAPGWVEQDPVDVLRSVHAAVDRCVGQRRHASVLAVGISNQRESLVVWERATGEPLRPMISWQDQRTAELCADYARRGCGDLVRARSGLPLDPMFSALKARWLLDAVDPGRVRASRGELCLGTVDSWLLASFGGEHVVEMGNAARTQLLGIESLDWDDQLLELFNIPREALPRIVPSVGPFPALSGLLAQDVPVAAVMGDSHAALFAQAGWRGEEVKVTYGTGSSALTLRTSADVADRGLASTVAWADPEPVLATEGNIRSSGATLAWLARAVGRTEDALAALAESAPSDGVYLVPAFAGLGAPHWDARATGLISGITFGTELPQLARAALESTAFQVEDLLEAMDQPGRRIETVLADGGATRNPFLMQVQADISDRVIRRAAQPDLSALGAAHLAGRACGLWSQQDLEALPRPYEDFAPQIADGRREELIAGWRAAVARARSDPEHGA